jgi:hypothetical protein
VQAVSPEVTRSVEVTIEKEVSIVTKQELSRSTEIDIAAIEASTSLAVIQEE